MDAGGSSNTGYVGYNHSFIRANTIVASFGID